jgi:hypothetical protein
MVEFVTWNVFMNISKLTNVDLKDNLVQELYPLEFRHTNKKYVNLAENRVLSAGLLLITNQNKLQIWLGANGLSAIHPHAFKNTTALLEVFPESISQSKNTFVGFSTLNTVVLFRALQAVNASCQHEKWFWFQTN